MRATDRTGLAIGVAAVLAALTLIPLSTDHAFVPLAAVLIAAGAAVTVGLRRARIGSGTVILAQILVVVLASVLLSLTMPGAGESWVEHYPSLWAAGIEHMRTQASPMNANDGVTLIFVTALAVVWILTDLLADGIGRPAWAIAPLATPFLVPAIGLGNDTGIPSFLCVAAGYLLILVAAGLNSSARWTRGLSRDSADGQRTAAPVIWRAAGWLVGPAVLAAVVFGVALPTLALGGLGIGNGPGGHGPLQLTDPTLDLKRNLNEPEDRVVIRYQTNQAGGVYLRLASLPQFSSAGWTSSQIQLDDGNTLPTIPGLGSVPSQRRSTTITVGDFGSQYLPLPYAPINFQAQGDWSYDPESLIVVNKNERPNDLRGLRYSVQSVDITPDPAGLERAGVGTPANSDITGRIPDNLPADLIQKSRDVTKDAKSPAARAAAIQAYLRSGEFTYSKEQLPGSGYQALENFLFKDKTGYCEQFAASMAMMARAVGIPSRVSVGFLPGHQDGDTWTVSSNDMHAWPELYFAGYGWVRFEPTPASVTGTAPAWTVQTKAAEKPTTSASPSSSASRSASASESAAAPTQQPTTTTGTTRRLAWVKPLLSGLGGLIVLAILAAPATIRVRRRHARLTRDVPRSNRAAGLTDTQVEDAWAEIRDTVLDFGGSWPDGSPRAIGAAIGERLDTDESASMGRVATLVERSRYARSFAEAGGPGELADLTGQIRHGIAAPAGPVRKLLAFAFPRSVFRRTPPDPPST